MRRYGRTDKKRGRKLFLGLLAVLVLAAGFYAVLPSRLNAPAAGGAVSEGAQVSRPAGAPASSAAGAPSQQAPSGDVSITVLGAGDDLIHSRIYRQAQQRAGGKGYDFTPVYARVAGRIRAADVAVVNQETVLAGRVLPPSNYPLFNSPTQVGDALVGAGFDVINHANNHILDMGEKGIRATLDYWDTKPVKVVGAYRSDADLENIRIVTAKGVRTAHIGVTEMTNGRYLPKNSQYRLIYAKDTALIQRLIKKAKSMADVVVVSVHWGTEDTYTLTQSQKTLAQQMVDWGADIIFGNHPHVVQKLTLLTRASDGAKCPVAFALGNFVSAQLYGRNLVSGLLTVTMTKSGRTGKTSYSGMKFTPIVTHYGAGFSGITIYPFSEYTDALAKSHGVRARTKDFSRAFVQKIIDGSVPKQYQDLS